MLFAGDCGCLIRLETQHAAQMWSVVVVWIIENHGGDGACTRLL
jgi:hypothetical protein